MKVDVFEQLAEKVRNWGRWGAEDQRGTLNHVGPEALKRGAAAVTAGKAFNLGLRFDKDGPADGNFRFNPRLYMAAVGRPLNPANPRWSFSDDAIMMSLQCATQWDALSHVHYDGMLYNGCKACDVLSEGGASKLGVEHLGSPGVMSRGVLLDIARFKGVDILPEDFAITPDVLNQVVAKQGVKIESGDIVLVRTGLAKRFLDGNKGAFFGMQSGLDPACAEWLHDTSAAAVAADNVAVEHLHAETMGPEIALPMHMLCLRDMGLPFGEMFNLEALAADCDADKRYTFLLSAPPLNITGAVGSPINPLALR